MMIEPRIQALFKDFERWHWQSVPSHYFIRGCSANLWEVEDYSIFSGEIRVAILHLLL